LLHQDNSTSSDHFEVFLVIRIFRAQIGRRCGSNRRRGTRISDGESSLDRWTFSSQIGKTQHSASLSSY
jgi:hypothetical protein